MATYNQISYGSKGSDVTELQKLLNQNGYTLDEDGKFGPKTQAAVKDYQQKNNLAVDGIVGNNTWGALTKASTTSATTPSGSTTSATTPAQDTGFKYGQYQASDTVKQAEQLLQQQLAQKPGAYQSQWQSQLNDVIQKILNREEFSYDLNGDALYQQYKGQAVNNGQMAMMDTMGQAAGLTGGYGSSYAQSVGQQAYQGELQKLNDKVPELYQLAMNQYNQEGQAMYDQASMLGTMEDQDYGRYRDQVSDYNSELDRLTEDARYQGELDYGKYIDGYNMAYGEYRDSKADEQWQAEFDEAKRQYDQQYALANKSSSSSSSSSNSSSGTRNWDNQGYSKDIVKKAQAFLGLDDVDGYWGKNSTAAAKAKGYNSLADVVAAMNGGGGPEPDPEANMLTYSDVALTAAQMRQKGASANDIYQYLSSVINSSNYKPTNSAKQDLAELKSGYVGSGR